MTLQKYARQNRNEQDSGRQPVEPPYEIRSSDRQYIAPRTSFSRPRQSWRYRRVSRPLSTFFSLAGLTAQQSECPVSETKDEVHQAVAPVDTESNSSDERSLYLVHGPLPWRPCYLRRRVLAVYVVVFAMVFVTLEWLSMISQRNRGLRSASHADHYLWTIGPAAMLAVVSTAWSRVDFQSKAAAPWIRLSQGPSDAKRTLLLDYVTMWQPWVVVKALQNADYTVACTSAILIALNLDVVASTGLATTDGASEAIVRGVPISLTTQFIDRAGALSKVTSAPFYSVAGVVSGNASLPDGVSQQFAFQQFLSPGLSPSASLRATVDAYSAWLDCEAANATMDLRSYSDRLEVKTSVAAAGCNISVAVISRAMANASDSSYFVRFTQASCANSTKSGDQRVVILAGKTSSTKNSTQVLQSTQLVCRPVHGISRVDVVKQDGKLVSIKPSDTKVRALSRLQPWDIAAAFFGSHNNEFARTLADTTARYSDLPINVDATMYLALQMQRKDGSATDPAALLDAVTLERVAQNYFRQYSAMAASQFLVQPVLALSNGTFNGTANGTSNGTAFLSGPDKVLVQAPAAHFLSIMLALSMVLAGVAAARIPREGFLPRSPSTIIDMMALLAHSQPLLLALRGTGGGNMSTIRQRLSGSAYCTGFEADGTKSGTNPGNFKIMGQPLFPTKFARSTPKKFPYPSFLHPLHRAMAVVVVVVAIITLELTLRYSKRNIGFGDADDKTYRHYLWTVFPDVVISLIAIYFSVAAMNVRALAPYAALRRGSTFEQSMNVDFLDMTSFAAFRHACRTKNLAVAGAVVASMLSYLFVIITAALFYSTGDNPDEDHGHLHSPKDARVVQDELTTRVVQGLLIGCLLASALSWYALPKCNILPRSPTSIASVGSLLADGNIFGLLDGEWQKPTATLAASFNERLEVPKPFQLGWEKRRRRLQDPFRPPHSALGNEAGADGVEDEVFAITAVRSWAEWKGS